MYVDICRVDNKDLFSLWSDLACNAGVFWGRANALAAILDFKRRGRLGRVERATKGEGISPLRFCKSNKAATINRYFGTRASPRKRLHCRLKFRLLKT